MANPYPAARWQCQEQSPEEYKRRRVAGSSERRGLQTACSFSSGFMS
jgi:hypothetical protein